jgi:hypothetical protein
MLVKLTSRNRLTLPKAVVESVGKVTHFEVQVRGGQIVLTPVGIQRADAVRAKLAELSVTQNEIDAAVAWAKRKKSRTRA